MAKPRRIVRRARPADALRLRTGCYSAPMDAPFLALIGIAGAVNAWILAAALLFRDELRRSAASARLALFLVAAGSLLGLFVFWHFDWLAYTLGARILHDTLALVAGAAFLDHVVCVLGPRPVPLAAYAPALAYALAGAILGEALVERVTVAQLVYVQMAYTVVATAIAVVAGRRPGASGRFPSQVAIPLAAMCLLHAVQVLRILLPANPMVFDAVPFAGAAMLIALNAYVLGDPRALRRLVAGPRRPAARIPLALSELEAYLDRERPFLNAALTAEELAGAVGISSRQLSTLLNREAGCSFYEFLQRYRVAEAKRLLRSPDERRTSVEAIGLMAGFRSRTTFYEAFRRDTGASPAKFRKRQAR